MTTIQATSQQQSYRFLRRVLQADAATSALSGLLFSVAAGPLATFLGLEAPWIILVTGILLLAFAADVYYVANRETLNPTFVAAIIVTNVLWVAGSALLLLTDWVAWTPAGFWAVAITADIVATFAVLQWIGLRRG